MRVLVTGGAGFIGSHFVKRLAAAGDDVVVLDKLTYAGNPANLEGAGHRARRRRHRRRRRGRRGRGRLRRDRQLRRRDPRRPLDPRPGRVHPHRRRSARRCCSSARAHGMRARAGLDRRGLRRRRGRRLARARTTRSRPSSPYGAPRPAATCRCSRTSRTYGVDALDHARLEHLRAEPVPGEADPAVHHERARRRAAAGLRRRPPGARLAARRGPLRRRSSSCCARARPARSTTSAAATSARTWRSSQRILELTGADASLIRHVEDRPGHDRRYSLDTPKLRALGWAPQQLVRRRASPETVDWYRDNRAWWEPIKSGEYREYYERAVRRQARQLLTAAGTGSPRVEGSVKKPWMQARFS